jgi:hypothetical protein
MPFARRSTILWLILVLGLQDASGAVLGRKGFPVPWAEDDLIFPPVTVAQLPPIPTPYMIYRVTNSDGNCQAATPGSSQYCTWSGTAWVPLFETGGGGGGSTLGEAVDANQSVTGTTAETIAHTFTIPAGELAIARGLQFTLLWTVATQGSSPASTYRVRFGPTGTIADTELIAWTRVDTSSLRVIGQLIRTGASTQVSTVKVETGSGTGVAWVDVVSTAHNLAAASYLTFSVDPGATTDAITLRIVGILSFGG